MEPNNNIDDEIIEAFQRWTAERDEKKRQSDLLYFITCVVVGMIVFVFGAFIGYSFHKPEIVEKTKYEYVEVPVSENKVEKAYYHDTIYVHKEPEYLIDFTNEDIDLMAKVVWSEAGSDYISYECKLAVAETIVNRVLDEDFPDNIEDVIFQDNAYYIMKNPTPNAECYRAVYSALQQREYPSTLLYFRKDYYHSYGYPYMDIDDVYFSTKNEVDR